MLRVHKFGIELEGGWDDRPRDYGRRVHDGSVRVRGRHFSGEIPSPPFTADAAGYAEALDFIEENYPDRVGKSCGLHVHMSFGADAAENAYAVGRLADSERFRDHIVDGLRSWGARMRVRSTAFYDRLDGDNEFCRAGWSVGGLVGGGDRYQIVNFCAWAAHRTVEIRVLPMFRSANLAWGAIRQVLELTNQWLAQLGPDEPHVEELDAPPAEGTHETIEADTVVLVGADETLEAARSDCAYVAMEIDPYLWLVPAPEPLWPEEAELAALNATLTDRVRLES